jgi:teichuronic acid biosynthesis glycosyltransferase TuaC
MKVLFICSGNARNGINSIVYNQGQSLKKLGVTIDYFTIKGKGFWPYFRHIFLLRKHINKNRYDIIHAHYSFSSFVATLSGANPLIVSLMGSDLLSDRFSRPLIFFFQKYLWRQTIVKSLEMHKYLDSSKTEIIPNGVNTVIFNSLEKETCQDQLDWDKESIHILFGSNPVRIEKNFSLTKMALALIHLDRNIVLHVLNDVANNEVPVYLNAADVLLLSSLHEGSPNVIKEAMACNIPIVTTEVGDVKMVLGNTEGCYITKFDPVDASEKIKQALEFRTKHGYTKGRERIIELGLDSETIASKIIAVYEKVLKIED